MIFGSKEKEEFADPREVLEALEKLLSDVEYFGSGELDQNKVDDVTSVLRMESERYARALREAIRLFGGGAPKDQA